jgi:hypothetical protein
MQKHYVAVQRVQFKPGEVFAIGDQLVHDSANNNKLSVYRNGELVLNTSHTQLGMDAMVRTDMIAPVEASTAGSAPQLTHAVPHGPRSVLSNGTSVDTTAPETPAIDLSVQHNERPDAHLVDSNAVPPLPETPPVDLSIHHDERPNVNLVTIDPAVHGDEAPASQPTEEVTPESTETPTPESTETPAPAPEHTEAETAPNFDDLTKQQIVDHAKEVHGIDLEKKGVSKAELIAQYDAHVTASHGEEHGN